MTRTHRNLIAWAKACAALLLLASPLAAEHLIVRGSYVIDGQLRQIGRVSGEPTMLDVTITPPLWHRASFLAALAVQLAAALVYAHKLRVRRLLELERIRTRIAADLHDDLGASLARVSLLSEATRRVLRERPDRAERMLDEIGTTSRELVTAAGDIAFAIDPEHGRLDDLAVRLRRFAEDLLAGSNIALCFSVDGEPADVVLSSDQRRHLLANASDARAEPDRAPRAMPRAIMSTRVRVRVHE